MPSALDSQTLKICVLWQTIVTSALHLPIGKVRVTMLVMTYAISHFAS